MFGLFSLGQRVAAIVGWNKGTLAKTQKGCISATPLLYLWALLGLNQRPSDYESDALTN